MIIAVLLILILLAILFPGLLRGTFWIEALIVSLMIASAHAAETPRIDSLSTDDSLPTADTATVIISDVPEHAEQVTCALADEDGRRIAVEDEVAAGPVQSILFILKSPRPIS